MKKLVLSAALAVFIPSLGFAQATFPTPAGGSRVAGSVAMCLNGSSQAVPCSVANPLQTSASGGGGGGGASTIADGADVTQGAVADAVVAAGAAGTVSAKLRRITTDLGTLIGKDFSTQTTLAAILAKIIAAPATEASLAAMSAKLPAALGGTTSAASLPVVLSSDGPFANQTGSLTETAPATDTASSGLNGRLQRIAQRLTTINTTIGTPIQATGGTVGLASGTTGGCTPAKTLSAASTNATSVKGSAGTLCSLTVINTTATLYYLKFYDKATAATCNSDTVLQTIPVPASTTGAGVAVPVGPYGWAFPTGITFCLTAGIADNDNANAATGVAINYSFK